MSVKCFNDGRTYRRRITAATELREKRSRRSLSCIRRKPNSVATTMESIVKMHSTATTQIEVKALKKIYETASSGAVHALGPIDLKIDEGEFISIVGPSGCGKSTFLRIVCGLTGVSDGKLLLEGSPISGPNRDIGVVFQSPTLLP